MSELSVVDPSHLTRIPEGLDPEDAVLVFHAGVALHGIKEAHIALGDNVLVTGQGPIGVFVSQLCKLCGAWKVIATDPSDKKLAISQQVGVDYTINAASENVPERVKELTGGRGTEVAAEVSGSPAALIDCGKAVARLARIAVIGWVMAPLTVSLADDFSPKGLEIAIAHGGHVGHWRQLFQRKLTGFPASGDKLFLLDLMKQGKLKSKVMITHRFPLKDLVKAWEFIDEEPDEYSQVLFVSKEVA